MPNIIGVRELKNQASRVLRTIREEMAEYVITLRGEPVAILRPLTEKDTLRLRQDDIDASIVELKSLADEVSASWTSQNSGVDIISEQRR